MKSKLFFRKGHVEKEIVCILFVIFVIFVLALVSALIGPEERIEDKRKNFKSQQIEANSYISILTDLETGKEFLVNQNGGIVLYKESNTMPVEKK